MRRVLMLLGMGYAGAMVSTGQDTSELLNRMKAMEDKIKALEGEVQELKGQQTALTAAITAAAPTPATPQPGAPAGQPQAPPTAQVPTAIPEPAPAGLAAPQMP